MVLTVGGGGSRGGVAMNNLKTAVLLISLSALAVYLGSLFGGRGGALIAFGLAVLMNVGSYWFSDRLVLKMYRAREVTESEAPELFALVAGLAQRAALPMPRVFVMPSDTPNAFATGRSPEHAAVAVTSGIMQILERRELEGVLAHELSHVGNRDILIASVAATLVAGISMLSNFARFAALFGRGDEDGPNPLAVLFVSMVAALGAVLIQLAISRSREFEADASAARLLGDGEPLARALEKLELGVHQIPMKTNPSTAATAHMFIVSPLTGVGNMGQLFGKLFRTHPASAERIVRLRDRSWAR